MHLKQSPAVCGFMAVIQPTAAGSKGKDSYRMDPRDQPECFVIILGKDPEAFARRNGGEEDR